MLVEPSRQAVLVHGKGGSPETSWLPWMREQLTARGYEVVVPKFPPGDDSRLAEWFQIFQSMPIDLSQTTFIAHARGAMALLRWIDSMPRSTRVHQVITAACNFDYQPNRTDGDEFYSRPLNYAGLRSKIGHMCVVHSSDDPYVPIEAGRQLAKHLECQFVGYEHAGHFGDTKLEAPELLEKVIDK